MITKQNKEDKKMSVKNITKENFENEVVKSEKVVLLDFFATWCGPCRMVSPIIDEIAEENDHIVVGKVDVDAQSELASQFQVYSIPTLVVMKDGKVLAQESGAKSKAQILAMLP
jgi:thioredoxin 1